jgi:pSer/pThr/pTyr-binding forkhead associated (FHA) protein
MHLQLLVVQGRPEGKKLSFGPGDHYLGRGPECKIRFNSDWVSRQHCLLRVTRNQVLLRDLGSRNGTLVNGQLLGEEQALGDGDQIQIGPVVFEVRLRLVEVEEAAEERSELVRPGGEESATGDIPLDSTVHHPLKLPEEPPT